MQQKTVYKFKGTACLCCSLFLHEKVYRPSCSSGKEKMVKKVAVIMGSDSDLPVVEKGIEILKEYGVPFEVHVYSAHRTPEEAGAFAKAARAQGFGVLICAAGMAAHLAGAFAANTTLPVIGIPCSSKVLEGMDALLSTVMMPPGIPVATVGVNTAKNAALLAIEILAVTEESLAEKLQADRDRNHEKIMQKDQELSARFNTLA